jgi:hypothetical protein
MVRGAHVTIVRRWCCIYDGVNRMMGRERWRTTAVKTKWTTYEDLYVPVRAGTSAVCNYALALGFGLINYTRTFYD